MHTAESLFTNVKTTKPFIVHSTQNCNPGTFYCMLIMLVTPQEETLLLQCLFVNEFGKKVSLLNKMCVTMCVYSMSIGKKD